MTLLDLAERCENATKADVGIDADIERALGMTRINSLEQEVFGNGESLRPRRYSGSLDAAMTLVPEGWWVQHFGQVVNTVGWAVRVETQGNSLGLIFGKTAALALCAAALRTRSTQEGDKG